MLNLRAPGIQGIYHLPFRRTHDGRGVTCGEHLDDKSVMTSHILWMVLRDSLIMVGIGAAAGVPAVLVLTRYTESLLFGVKPQDPAAIAASGLLLAVSAMAAFLPALRAMRVQPMDALRQE
jgi:ABC-type antimicrobial peptide transport system permease subunit